MLTAARRSHIWQPETSLCICAPIILCSNSGSPPQAECVSEMNFAYVWGERREEPGERREEQHRQEIPLTHMWRRWTCTAAWPSLWPLQECERTEQMSHYTRRMQFWFSSNSSAGLHQKVFSPEINNWCCCSFSSLWIGHKTKNDDVQKSGFHVISLSFITIPPHAEIMFIILYMSGLQSSRLLQPSKRLFTTTVGRRALNEILQQRVLFFPCKVDQWGKNGSK